MAETVAFVRDILLSIWLAAGIFLSLLLILLALLLFFVVRSLLKSVTRIVNDVGEFSDLTVENLVTPLREGVSFSTAVGNAFGFVTGFLSGLRGERRLARDQGDGRGRPVRDRRRERSRRRRG